MERGSAIIAFFIDTEMVEKDMFRNIDLELKEL